MRLIPTREQWAKWSLPSKLTAIGTLLGLLSIILTLIPFNKSEEKVANNVEENKIYVPSINYEIKVDSSLVELSIPDNELRKDFPGAMKKYHIKYPIIKYENNTYVEGKINNLIKTFFSHWDVDINNIRLSKWPGEINCNYDIAYKIHNLLGIRFNLFWYSTGAAHGNEEIITYNINLSKGELFDYRDLFESEYVSKIDTMLAQKIRVHDCPCIFNGFKFDNNERRDFYFKYDGIVIVFRKYEVACGVCGPIEIKLLYSEIKEFVKQNGPLEFL